MRSIGIDLENGVRRGLLRFQATRPTVLGLEGHLTRIYQSVRDFDPQLVILDPVTNLASAGSTGLASSMLMRLIDFLKTRQVTVVLTSLTSGGSAVEGTDVGISSLIDTWILLRNVEANGERNRAIHVLKSRGTKHSNQVREFRLTRRGIELIEAYLGPDGVLIGSARTAQQAREKASAADRRLQIERTKEDLERRRAEFEAEIASRSRAFEAETQDLRRLLTDEELREERPNGDREEAARRRGLAAGADDGSIAKPERKLRAALPETRS